MKSTKCFACGRQLQQNSFKAWSAGELVTIGSECAKSVYGTAGKISNLHPVEIIAGNIAPFKEVA
jgi:hypothetical protein